ncbi:kinase-like domain-containing protein [Colletotrichum godetiae]|uniref:Kinase-like domain-containing protein n=1 Tax=Colletotrichum godetiae TaxID=1209918 RepID=A0AAJ0AH45_9PEZI|nr:kinase-like domain-containing protein [Colletotrichum godetiae]KAK1672242.1 kinase-like domain-containing protein [Colletotrichum godetiae]
MSTVVGVHGRSYTIGEVLRQRRSDLVPLIIKAKSKEEVFILKSVTKEDYDLSLRLATHFASCRRLRMHTDCNPEEGILIYPYYQDTLLSLIEGDGNLPTAERKKILRGTAEAIQELHTKGWIHCDIKPDNILVNWTCDDQGTKTVTDVALGDFDIAYELPSGQLSRRTRSAIGNVMWRSPEGQTGITSKASDVFSFGLVCIYVFGGGKLLLIDDYEELTRDGITAEQDIITRHFSYFGPAPEELFEQASNEKWTRALRSASAAAEGGVRDQPGLRFTNWSAELGREAQDLISGMTNLNPTSRIPIEEVIKHRWLQGTP